jgi:hypothetical protein
MRTFPPFLLMFFHQQLRQFEASSMGAKYFSKFTQERGNTSAYLMLEIQTVLLRCGSDIFPMHEGMFSSNL